MSSHRLVRTIVVTSVVLVGGAFAWTLSSPDRAAHLFGSATARTVTGRIGPDEIDPRLELTGRLEIETWITRSPMVTSSPEPHVVISLNHVIRGNGSVLADHQGLYLRRAGDAAPIVWKPRGLDLAVADRALDDPAYEALRQRDYDVQVIPSKPWDRIGSSAELLVDVADVSQQ